jgi:2-deoxystreptamine N-acetyl-D-glucosaminyltransferase/2-deoxystreptamine glucosyltransferase
VLRFGSVFEPGALTKAWVPFDPVGGMQTHTGELTRCLDRLGVAQAVFTSRMAGPAGVTRFGEYAVIVRTGVRWPALRQLWAPPALPVAMRVRGPVDVVHAHAGEDLAVLPVARIAAARHRCPLVVTVHCSVRHTVRDPSVRGVVLRRFGGAIERRALAAADAVIVLTPSAARRLRRDGVPADRVHVIPSGFAPGLFERGGREDPDPFSELPRPRVAYVGRLAAQKNVGVLIEAFARCPGAASLVVVGDGPCRAALERRARASRREVRFTGFIDHARIPGVLRHVDVLVLPSAYEELGSVLVEAMATGLPVVASDVGGIPDLVRDGQNGLLVTPGCPVALAGAIGRLLGDPRTAARLGAEARRTVRDHAWPVLATRVIEVYRQAVDAHARRRWG